MGLLSLDLLRPLLMPPARSERELPLPLVPLLRPLELLT